jgi:putative endonuclease
MEKQYFVYIMTNISNSVLYTGVTSDLKKRSYQHRHKLIEGFTYQYNITKLVYYEVFSEPLEAISREKKIKGGSRQKKIELVNRKNAEWRDLYDEI